MTDSLAMYGVLPDGWADADVEEITAQPMPELPLEVWHREPFSAERAQAALVALCRGN